MVIGIFSIAPVAISSYLYMWDTDSLVKLASIVTILSLIGAPIAYFVRQYENEKSLRQIEVMEKERTSKNLYRELFSTLSAIKGATFPKNLIDVEFNGKTLIFTNRFLNHNIYDSLIASGGIKFLDSELHQKIQNIFNMIENHNYYLRLALGNMDGDGKILEDTIRYYILLDKYEKKLLDEIPPVMDHLEKKFGFKSTI